MVYIIKKQIRLFLFIIIVLFFNAYAYGQRRGNQQEEQWQSIPMVISNDMGRNFTSQNGTLGKYGGQVLAVFEVKTNNTDITSLALGLKKKAVENMADVVEKYSKKAKEWAETAQREGVNNFSKPLYSKLKPGVVDVTRLGYTTNGESYSKTYTSSTTTRNYLLMGYPTFVIDEDGKCFVTLASNVGIMKVVSNKSIQSSTTVSSGGLFNFQTPTGHTVSREVEDYDLGWVHIYIPISELDKFVVHLRQLAQESGKMVDDDKAKDSLFK